MKSIRCRDSTACHPIAQVPVHPSLAALLTKRSRPRGADSPRRHRVTEKAMVLVAPDAFVRGCASRAMKKCERNEIGPFATKTPSHGEMRMVLVAPDAFVRGCASRAMKKCERKRDWPIRHEYSGGASRSAGRTNASAPTQTSTRAMKTTAPAPAGGRRSHRARRRRVFAERSRRSRRRSRGRRCVRFRHRCANRRR